MTLPREQTVAGVIAAYQDFHDLVVSLSDDEWRRPSRCEGWTVADVAAHVVGQLTDVASLRLEGLGSPEVTQREVDDRRGRTPAELAEELAASLKLVADMARAFDDEAWNGPPGGGLPGTLGFGVEALWFDTYVHADDIRAAIGRASVRNDGLIASLSHIAAFLTEQGWGPATIAAPGWPEFAVGDGSGKRVSADALDLVLAASGRGDPKALGLDESVNIYRG